jgi:hypothetical protein
VLALWVGMAMAVLVVAVVTVGTVPEKADAAGRFKKVTKSFKNPGSITVPASGNTGVAGPYPSEIDAKGFRRGHVRDVNLIFWNFNHAWPDDVDMLLVHRGQNRTVMSDVGGSTDIVNTNIILDDEAGPTLPDEGAIDHNDAWKPHNYETTTILDTFPSPAPNPPNPAWDLSGFDGTNPNGTWSLYVNDDDLCCPDNKILEGWSLQITARVRR